MSFQEVPNTCRVDIPHEGSDDLAGSRARWSVYFSLLGGWDETSLAGLLEIVDTWIGAQYVGLLHQFWTVTTLVATDLSEEDGAQATLVSDTAGGITDDPLPATVCALITLATSGGGSPRSGRMYWPVGGEGDTEGNEYASAFVTACTTRAGLLKDAVEEGIDGAAMVVVSRYDSTNDDIKLARQELRAAIAASKRPSGVVKAVSSTTARALVASQRDRRPD